jgi:hypothetical protein
MFPGKMASAKKNGTSLKVAPEAAADSDDVDDDGIPGTGDDTKEPAIDPARDETLNILGDLVDLSAAPKTASTTKP